VVGDHGQVTVVLAVGDLGDPDPVDLVEAGVVEVVGHYPADDVGDGLPAHPQQPRHRCLVDPLGQPADHVFEVAGAAGPRPSPRHVLGADPTAAAAVQTADPTGYEQPAAAHVQMPPPPSRPVIDSPRRPAARATQPTPPMPDRNLHRLRCERHIRDGCSRNLEHLVECSSGAHELRCF